VELGAVVMVPTDTEVSIQAIRGTYSHPGASEDARPLCSPRTPILGNDALQLWIERVRQVGVRSLWLASSAPDQKPGSQFADLAREGVEKLLVINLKSYAEMDLADLLRFHCERQNSVTDAQDEHGTLGVRLLDRCAMGPTVEEPGCSYAQTESSRTHYQFQGYAKRLLSSQERQDLVRDGLTAACAMRPVGTEIRDQVWIAEGAELEDSVRVVGPAFIGPRTVIRAGATIGPFASVERDCVVDCGTTVERSTVLPGTYLGSGLLIQQSLVDGNCLENLEWRTIVDLEPADLGHKIARREFRKRRFVRKPVKAGAFFEAEEGDEWKSVFHSPMSPSPSWVRVEL
jgi:carbonic anhydrase/acetyltransferase-like protein (isoleucine patch superfamily)